MTAMITHTSTVMPSQDSLHRLCLENKNAPLRRALGQVLLSGGLHVAAFSAAPSNRFIGDIYTNGFSHAGAETIVPGLVAAITAGLGQKYLWKGLSSLLNELLP